MDAFRKAIFHCGFFKLPFRKYRFTWNKKRGNGANAQVRLDKAYINEVWRLHMPSLEVLHI